jgi:pseudouridine kinase
MDLQPLSDLGQQERAVLDAIAANPFVSQQHIAQALGLARSTVAAHVVALVQKGHILGRGYVLPEARRIVCVGGATVDRKYHAPRPLIAGTSNPVAGGRAFGGVARNVCENLARLGQSVSLVSVLGEDEAGDSVAAFLRDLGVDVTRVLRVAGRATAEYVAVMEADGSLAFGLADMGILDLLTPDHLERSWPHLASAGWVFADCNLPAKSLAFLLQKRPHSRFQLALDGVSTPKVTRLPDDLSSIDVLFLNLDEARALLRDPGAGPEAAAAGLRTRGAGAVVLTRGAEGVLLATGDGIWPIASVRAETRDVTGAGDALIAGTLAGLSDGSSLREALGTGTLVAALTTESAASVHPDLSPAFVAEAATRLQTLSGGPA